MNETDIMLLIFCSMVTIVGTTAIVCECITNLKRIEKGKK